MKVTPPTGAGCDRLTVKVYEVVPLFPSTCETSLIESVGGPASSLLRSARWIHLHGDRIGRISRFQRVEQRLARGLDDEERSVVAPVRDGLEDQLGARQTLSPQRRRVVLDPAELGGAVANLADAVRRRVLAPLGVEDITTGAQRDVAGRRAAGHTQGGTQVPATAASATRWRGSASALALFTTATSDTVRGPLARAFALMMRTRSPGPDASLPVALGWRVLRLNGRDIYWHDALDAPGFSAYVAIDPGMRRSVAVLSNTSRPVDAIAGQLLLGRVPVITPAPPSGSTSRQPPIRSRRRGRR